MEFTKMHGLGNDFIIINNLDGKLKPKHLAELSLKLCDRHFGIGADGMVLLNSSPRSLFYMQIFNSDGSEAEMCGNAIRCLAKYLWDRKMVPGEELAIDTLSGLKDVKLLLNKGKLELVRVDMGKPVLESRMIPLEGPFRREVINERLVVEDKELFFTAVNMGNPHCVIFVPELNNIPWHIWGEAIEKEPLFPQKTNVEFVERESSREIKINVWERGAGPTLACGTGACASVVAGVLTGRLERDVQVHLPGGSLRVSWAENGTVYMEGPAEEVFSGNIELI